MARTNYKLLHAGDGKGMPAASAGALRRLQSSMRRQFVVTGQLNDQARVVKRPSPTVCRAGDLNSRLAEIMHDLRADAKGYRPPP